MHQNFNVNKMKANILSMIKSKESKSPDLKKTVSQVRKMSVAMAGDQFRSNKQPVTPQMIRPRENSNISNNTQQQQIDRSKQKIENSSNSFKSNDIRNSKNSNTSLKISDIRINNIEKSSHSNNSQINSSGKQNNNQLMIKNQMESSMVSSQIMSSGHQKKQKKNNQIDSINEDNNLPVPHQQIKKTKSRLFQFQNVEHQKSIFAAEHQQQSNQPQIQSTFLKVPDKHDETDKQNQPKKMKKRRPSKNVDGEQIDDSKPSNFADIHSEVEKFKFTIPISTLDVHHDQIRPKRLSRFQIEPESDKVKQDQIRPKRPSRALLEAEPDKTKARKSKDGNPIQIESPPIKINTQSNQDNHNLDQSKRNDSWSQSLSSQNSEIEKSGIHTKRSKHNQEEKMFKRVRRNSLHVKNSSHTSLDNSKDKIKNKEKDKTRHYFKKIANRMNKKDKHKIKKQDHLINDQDITIEFETPLLQTIIQIQQQQDEYVQNRHKTIDMIINQQVYPKLLNIDSIKEKQIIQDLCNQYNIDILQFVPNHAVNADLEKDLTKVTLNTDGDQKQDVKVDEKPKKGRNDAIEAKMLKQLSDLSDLMHKADELSLKSKSEKILQNINYKSNKTRYQQHLDPFSIDNSNKVNVIPGNQFDQSQLKVFDDNLKKYLNDHCGELELEDPKNSKKELKQLKKVPKIIKQVQKKEELIDQILPKFKSKSLHQIKKQQLDNYNPQYSSNSHFFKQINQFKQNQKETYDLKQNIIQFYLTARTAQKGMQMKSKQLEGILLNYKNQIDQQYNMLDQTRDDHYNSSSYNFRKYLSEKDFKKKLFNYIINQVQKSERRVILNQFKSINVDVVNEAPKPKISADIVNSATKPKINLPQINTLLV